MNKMKKYLIAITLMLALALAGCAGNTNNEQASTQAATQEETTKQAELADGVYTAEFHTDSSMFHVNEACDGKGKLTVKNGQLTEERIDQSLTRIYKVKFASKVAGY